jgi:ribosomal protein L37AE/L43A
VKGLSLVSRLHSLVCPFCEMDQLRPSSHDSMRCRACAGHLSGAILETLQCISALPDALESHPCECGHPEMRHLPDGVFHCSACGSEVLPCNAPPIAWSGDARSEAYWAGWVDGRFDQVGGFADNPHLAQWGAPSDRLDYYQGHRAGYETRRANQQAPQARGRLPRK